MEVLGSQGITRALIDASGDILVSDSPPGESGWRVGIAPLDAEGPPSRYLSLRMTAVTTSGDAFQHVVIAGRRYSHIVDPHTGLGLTDRGSVTVVARDCITADSFATAVSVLGPKRGLKLIDETPGAAALIVRNIDDEITTTASSRLADFERAADD
jgi:FAD:protein FMN transferase